MTSLFYCLPLTSPWLQAADKNQPALSQCLNKLNEETSPLVLYGDAFCGKTVLLFQAAVAYASQDYHVTFISRQPLSRMPYSVHGMIRPETAGLLSTLTFLYMKDVKDLISYLSEIHTRTLLPDVLIVDDLEHYLRQLHNLSPEAGSAKLCALLVDALAFIRSKRSSGFPTLLLGCQKEKTNIQTVFRQFGFLLANIKSCSSQDQHYQLDLHTSHVTLTLSYTIQPTGLILQTVSMGT